MSDTEPCIECGRPIAAHCQSCRECYPFGPAASPSVALDVERLARAMLSRDFTTLHHCADCFEAEAETIAAEYARLTPSEPPVGEPTDG